MPEMPEHRYNRRATGRVIRKLAKGKGLTTENHYQSMFQKNNWFCTTGPLIFFFLFCKKKKKNLSCPFTKLEWSTAWALISMTTWI